MSNSNCYYPTLFNKNHTQLRFVSKYLYPSPPRQAFFKSFLSGGFAKANKIIFGEDHDRYIQWLKTASLFSDKDIAMILDDFDHIVKASYEFRASGVKTIASIWQTLSSRSRNTLGVQRLMEEIVNRRDLLLRLLLATGEYEFFQTKIMPVILQYVPSKSLNYLDRGLQAARATWNSSESEIDFDQEEMEKYLSCEDIPLEQRREFLKLLITPAMRAAKPMYVKIKLVGQFLDFANKLESEEWFKDPKHTEYDDIFVLIGLAPVDISCLHGYLHDLLAIVEPRFDKEDTRLFFTHLMRVLVDKAPSITNIIFKFKLSEKKKAEDKTEDALSPLDLAYAMKARAKFNEDAVFDLFLEQSVLQDARVQEEIFLSLCAENKDWKSLQKRFEMMAGKEDLPSTIHYGIAIQALEYLKADVQLEKLYRHIKARKMNANAAVFTALMKMKLRHEDQSGLDNLLQEYISLSQDKSAPAPLKDVHVLVPFTMRLFMEKQDYTEVLQRLHSYLENEVKTGVKFVSDSFLSEVLIYFADNCALREFQRLRNLVSRCNRESSEFHSAIVHALSTLGRFAEAEEVAFEAHGNSAIPFFDFRIYSSQLRNYTMWLQLNPPLNLKRSIERRIFFILASWSNEHYSMFQAQVGGVEFLAGIMDLLNNQAKQFSRERGIRKLRGHLRRAAATAALIQDQRHMKYDIALFLPLLRLYLSFEKFNPPEVMRIHKLMKERNIRVTAEAYYYVLGALTYMDSKKEPTFRRSKRMLEQLLRNYGVFDENPATDVKLDFQQNCVSLSKVVLQFQKNVPAEIADEIVEKFLAGCQKKLKKDAFPLKLKLRTNSMQRLILKRKSTQEYVQFLTETYNQYSEMLNYMQNVSSENEPFVIPPFFSREFGEVLVEMIQMHMNLNGTLDEKLQNEVLDLLLKGVTMPNSDYNKLLDTCLKSPNRDLDRILKVIEKYLADTNLSELTRYQKKKICYKLCMLHMALKYGDEAVEKKFSILSKFYNIEPLNQTREQLEPKDYIINFLRSSRGYLFNIGEDPFLGSSMTIFEFIDYFNPSRRIKGLNLVANTFRTMKITLQKEIMEGNLDVRYLELNFPKTMKLYSSKSEFYVMLSRFNSEIDRYYRTLETKLPDRNKLRFGDQKTIRIEKSKDVLKYLLLKTDKNVDFYISKDAKLDLTPMLHFSQLSQKSQKSQSLHQSNELRHLRQMQLQNRVEKRVKSDSIGELGNTFNM